LSAKGERRVNDRAFWVKNHNLSSRLLASTHGGDDGNWRRKKRKAKSDYPDLFDSAKSQRGIAVFDIHYPENDKKLWANILRFTEDFDPDVFVFGGDNMDCEPVTRWVTNRSTKIEGKRLKADYAGFTRDVLDPLPISQDCRRIFHLGNHEDWVAQYEECHPEIQGFIGVRENLDLSAWEVYDYGDTSQVGKLYFHHGEYCLQFHANKMATIFHRNLAYGHMHTSQAHTIVSPLDSEAHTAVSIPCACGLNPHYSRNRPNAWVSGFAVFHIAPDGLFNLYPVIAVDGKFTAPNGVRYE
jgi:hypothetical protein